MSELFYSHENDIRHGIHAHDVEKCSQLTRLESVSMMKMNATEMMTRRKKVLVVLQSSFSCNKLAVKIGNLDNFWIQIKAFFDRMILLIRINKVHRKNSGQLLISLRITPRQLSFMPTLNSHSYN